MDLNGYKITLIIIGLIGMVLIVSANIAGSIKLPSEDQFSEIHLLGTQHKASNYPYNLSPGQNYPLFLDVGNHMGASAYYLVYIKLLNASDPMPNQNSSSPIQPIYTYLFLSKDEQIVEYPADFSISNVSFFNNQSNIGNIRINGINFIINKPALWNQTTLMFQYKLLFELWQFNTQSNTLQYDNRFVSLQLNCTGIDKGLN
jgi:uncharacterized membrane protein